jgi:hypothetical protein
MNEVMKAQADNYIAAYQATQPRYRKAAAEAARIHVEMAPEGSDRQAYWLYIATSLLAAVVFA